MSGVEIGLVAISAGLQVAGAAQQRKAAKKQEAASRREVAATQEAEAARQRSAELADSRRRRQLLRESIIARSDILSGAVARNVGLGSSIVTGGQQAVTADAGQQVADIGQQAQLRNDIFAANASAASARSSFNVAGIQSRSGQQAINLGQSIISNFGPISRVGHNLTGTQSSGIF